MKRKLMIKLVTAFLCTLSFSLFFGGSMSWMGMFWPVLVYFALLPGSAYFLVGIPSSILIDRFNEKYLVNFHVTVRIFAIVAMYALAGMIAVYLIFVVITGGKVLGDKNFIIDEIGFFIFGAVAALWFYLVSIIVSFISKILRKNKDEQFRL